jgi:hypothetical protein
LAAGQRWAGRTDQILADRFARGEIDEQEYRARLAALRDTSDRLVEHKPANRDVRPAEARSP